MSNKGHIKPALTLPIKRNERDEITGRVCLKKGTQRSKYIGYGKDDHREYFFHATKGWRSQSLGKVKENGTSANIA